MKWTVSGPCAPYLPSSIPKARRPTPWSHGGTDAAITTRSMSEDAKGSAAWEEVKHSNRASDFQR